VRTTVIGAADDGPRDRRPVIAHIPAIGDAAARQALDAVEPELVDGTRGVSASCRAASR